MAVYPLPPVARPAGLSVGILLLDFREPHAIGDTANAATYPFPTIFATVRGASVERVTSGDPSVCDAVVDAAKWLEEQGAASISSNCGLMIHYQDAVRDAVDIPVFLSSLLQVPLAVRSIRSDRSVGVIASFVDRVSPAVLALAGVSAPEAVVRSSIEESPEFRNLSNQALDTDAFEMRLTQAALDMKERHPNLGAIVIECATFTPYAHAIQRAVGLPVYDFVSLIEFAHTVTHRRRYAHP